MTDTEPEDVGDRLTGGERRRDGRGDRAVDPCGQADATADFRPVLRDREAYCGEGYRAEEGTGNVRISAAVCHEDSRIERHHAHIAGRHAEGRAKYAIECRGAIEAAGIGDIGNRTRGRGLEPPPCFLEAHRCQRARK